MAVVHQKQARKELEKLRIVIIILGGNDVCRRGRSGNTEMVMSYEEVLKLMDMFVRWLRLKIPDAEIRVADLIPRISEGGRFAMGARHLNSRVERVDEKHRHVSMWRCFVNEPRSWKNKNGKGNRTTKLGLQKLLAAPPPDKARFDLRPFLYGPDYIHLSESGMALLTNVLNWLCLDVPSDILEIVMTVQKEGKPVPFSCKASLKF